ncbi:MAG: diaminopimelate decarboxylase [Hyphomicrobiales bacterium]|nr:diaminopimelate decarboxylase [Rickettsiales bacterium]MCP5361094.1 diaminopimelate decarboxylase [Hyphomicrobiales bacterium]
MDHFTYRNGILHAEDVPVPAIAEAVGTPFYCYSTATLTRHYTVLEEAFSALSPLFCFAVKANSNQAVLRTLGQLGAGADCVSGGEVRRAILAGIPAERIVFSSVGKTVPELEYAVQENILQFNVESLAELHMLSDTATRLGKTARIALRINPAIDADKDVGTHAKISTGKKIHKFGIAFEKAEEAYALAANLPGLKITGISVHIGSQFTSLEPFRWAFPRIIELTTRLKQNGLPIDSIDLGGGLGIPYHEESPPQPDIYAAMIREFVEPLNCRLILEPGRVIAGNAGILITSVILTKHTGEREFVIVDAAMNDLMRPSLYDAYHEIIPVTAATNPEDTRLLDIAGAVCETGDVFARGRLLPPMQAGDLLAFRSTGAYGAVMAGNYNTRLLIPEVMVHGNAFAIVRKRQTYDTLIGMDEQPPWLA